MDDEPQWQRKLSPEKIALLAERFEQLRLLFERREQERLEELGALERKRWWP